MSFLKLLLAWSVLCVALHAADAPAKQGVLGLPEGTRWLGVRPTR